MENESWHEDDTREQQNVPADTAQPYDAGAEESPDLPAGSLASFPVDISREEYIRFNLLVSENTGFLRFRRGQILLLLGLAAVSLFMMVSDFVFYQRVDPVMVLMVLFLMAAGAMLYFGAPAYVRRAAERAYDQQRLGGQTYYGRVTVYPDRMEKRSVSAAVSLRFTEGLYIETRDMMVLLSPRAPAMVLPARCLTEADADGVRRAVLAGVPVTRQKLSNRMIPAATAHIDPPDTITEPGWDDEESLRFGVDYTREEFIKMATDSAGRAFLKMLPYTSGMAVLAALMFGLLYDFGMGLASFVVMIGALCAFQILGPRSRAGRVYDQMPRDRARITIYFTEPGLRVHANAAGEGMKLSWSAITRAVERADCVEFYAQAAFLRIPKRCIEDFGALRAFVDSHMPVRK